MAPLPYDQWWTKTWTVRTAQNTDLDKDDTIKFSEASGSSDIEITSIGCNHDLKHKGSEWLVTWTGDGTPNRVEGTISGEVFQIISVTVVDPNDPPKTRLIASPIPATPSTGGAVCWTAEDG